MTSNSPRPWWQTAVVYQIYPRSFMDADGNGIGDLRGIASKLPYLADTLGIDAVWISPFFTSPMKDFGYDVADFEDVDPIFGTLQDAEELIEAIHGAGMRVILDYVSNHSSDKHCWFQESRSSRTSDKRDWYIWRDPAPDGGPPNNWLSVFGGRAWTYDEATRQYYLHSFLASQPDLNWRNPELRDAMHRVLEFWIQRGVDGFRIDAAHFVGKDEQLRDNPPAPPDARQMHRPMGAYDRQLHLYDVGTDFAHEVYKGVRQLLDRHSSQGSERLMIGEMHLYDWDKWASFFGPELDEFHLPYNFGLLNTDWDAGAIADLIRAIESAVPDGAWPNWVFGNHDEPRIVSRLGVAQARAAMVLLVTLRGTPTIYYGDELGMIDADVPPELRQDPWGLQVQELNVGRDPQRSPMLWSAQQPYGGFTQPDAQPWLPVVDPATYSVEAQLDAPDSMLSLTRRALSLRKERESLKTGSISILDDLPSDSLGFVRTAGEDQTLVLISFADEDLHIELDPALGGLLLLSSLDSQRSGATSGTVRLAPCEALVIGIQD